MTIKGDKEKIEKLLAYLKLSRNALGKEIGEKNGSKFNHIIAGRNGISEKLAKLITDRFPEINYNWLVSDDPNMTIDQKQVDKLKNDINYIETSNGSIDIDVIIDAILLNQEKFESNIRYKKYLKSVKNEAIVEYQEKLLKEYNKKKNN